MQCQFCKFCLFQNYNLAALVAKFVRDGVFQNDREVQDAFRFAFNQSPRDAFEPLIRGEVEATHAAWRAQ